MNIPHLTQAARKYVIAFALILLLLAIAGFIAHLSLGSDKTYRNDTYHFSVPIPKAYTVSEFPENSGIYYNVVFAHATDEVQLFLSPWPDNGSVLSKESLIDQYPQYPGMEDAESFNVAPGVIGLAMHNDPADPAAFSDVWFAYKGNLYQFESFRGGIKELLPIVRTIELY